MSLTRDELHAAAQVYLAEGLIPVYQRGKKYAQSVRGWTSSDFHQAATALPPAHANALGLMCGPQYGLLALDFDTHESGHDFVDNHPEICRTWIEATPRGIHILFRCSLDWSLQKDALLHEHGFEILYQNCKVTSTPTFGYLRPPCSAETLADLPPMLQELLRNARFFTKQPFPHIPRRALSPKEIIAEAERAAEAIEHAEPGQSNALAKRVLAGILPQAKAILDSTALSTVRERLMSAVAARRPDDTKGLMAWGDSLPPATGIAVLQEDVIGQLKRTDRGEIRNTANNAELLMNHMPEIKAHLFYNEFAHRTEWDKQPIALWQQKELRCLLEHYGLSGITSPQSRELLLAYGPSLGKHYHPILDHIREGADRAIPLDMSTAVLYHKVLRLPEDSPTRELHYQYLRKTLVAAAQRLLQPGVRHETMLILASEKQGLFKSSFARLLAGKEEWFYSGSFNIDDEKKVGEVLRGKWICEWPEINKSLASKSVEAFKAFVEKRTDRFREAYAEGTAQDHPRGCIFLATSNRIDILRDITGSRRYWLIELERQADLGWLQENWAGMMQGALDAVEAGEPNYLLPEWDAKRLQAAEAFQEHDELEPAVAAYCTERESKNKPISIAEMAERADLFPLSLRRPKMRFDHQLAYSLRSLGYKRTRGSGPGRPMFWIKSDEPSE